MRTLLTNISSLQTQRAMGSATKSLGKVYERLSSGLRISRASDDAAGLAVASQLNVSSRVYSQGARNVNDAISMFNIAEGAVTELSSILIRISELANQSANGVLSNPQRQALDAEAQALRSEFNRIIDTTQFNGMTLLDGAIEEVSIQAGGETLDVLFADLGTSAVGDGTFQARQVNGAGAAVQSVAASDLNGDGHIDIVSTSSIADRVNIMLGNGDGTLRAYITFAAGDEVREASVGDVNGDGISDLTTVSYNDSRLNVLLGNGDGTFKARLTYAIGSGATSIQRVDVNADGILDAVSLRAHFGYKMDVLLGNSDGSFKARVTAADLGAGAALGLSSYDVDSDGITDFVFASPVTNSLNIVFGNGNGTFGAAISYAAGNGPYSTALADVNRDGNVDVVVAALNDSAIQVLFGNSNGTVGAAVSYSAGTNPTSALTLDVNGDGNLDVVTTGSTSDDMNVLLGNGDGSFKARSSFPAGDGARGIVAADLNNDGVPDFITASSNDSSINVLLANGSSVSTLSEFTLRTQSDSLTTLDRLASARRSLSRTAGDLGSSTSRLNVAVTVLRQRQENSEGAASKIQNADVAVEAASLTRLNILQQAAAAVLAQANQLPSLALRLLRQ